MTKDGICKHESQDAQLVEESVVVPLRKTNRESDRTQTWNIIVTPRQIRDINAAAALGRPPHIQDEFCDIESPQLADFEVGYHGSDPLSEQAKEQRSYFINLAHLSVISKCPYAVSACHHLSKVILVSNALRIYFAPKPRSNITAEKPALFKELREWEEALPSELIYQGLGKNLKRGFWASMLHLIYKWVCP